MPRAKRTTEVLTDQELPGLDQLDRDPEPTAARRGPGRPRKATGTTRGPGKIPARSTTTGRVMSKAQMISQVNGEVYTYLTLAQAAWSLRDPECAGAAEPQIAVIAEKITAMIARNDSLLTMVTKSGIIGDVIGLLGAVLPIVRAVWTAHGPGGHGHDEQGEIDANRYPAYSG